MLVALAVAVTVLASPPPLAVASQLPKGAVFLVLAPGEASAALPLPSLTTDRARVRRVPGGLAGAPCGGEATPPRPRCLTGPQLFVLLAPMQDQLGVRCVASF